MAFMKMGAIFFLNFQTQTLHYVYVIVSQSKCLRFYVGMTENKERRLFEHNMGKTKSTKGYRPWKLFFTEEYKSRSEAREREKYLKSGTGKEMIKKCWHQSV